MNSRILIGAMSGTSADGVDAAAVEVRGRGLGMTAKYLGHVEHAYDDELRRRIFAVREGGAVPLDELASLGREITLAYGDATRSLLSELSLKPSEVAAVAAHGQTLYHAPPNTVQWLDPSLLAAETGIAVVSDFRRADCAAGGQGAPLVPFGDWVLFRHPTKTRVILNLGGIANLTYLPAGGGIEDVTAFDTGPGCCLIDHVLRTRGGGRTDDGGVLTAAGQADALASDFVSEHPFVRRPPPKSTDGPAWVADYERWRTSKLPRLHLEELHHELATVADIAAGCVADGMYPTFYEADHPWDAEIVLAGGGSRNAGLVAAVRDWVKFQGNTPGQWAFAASDDLGVPSQAREAVCFALLAAATLDGEPSNVPNATGAARRVVLGSVTSLPVFSE